MAARGWLGLTPQEAREWARVGGYVISVLIGGFMLVWQTVFVSVPSPLLVGAGLVLAGVPAGLSLDRRLLRQEEDRQAKEDSDRWSHLP